MPVAERMIHTNEYTLVAEVRGHDVVWFRRFGDYQGEWLMLSRDADRYYIWKGYYGSCSGCDDLQAAGRLGREMPADDPAVLAFAKDYQPFLELTNEAALRVAEGQGNLLRVLPKNVRSYAYDPDDAGRQLALAVKRVAGRLSPTEILEIDNLEQRRQAIEAINPEIFAAGVDAEVVERTDEGVLYRAGIEVGGEPFCFLLLEDASTDRRYILRVAPDHETVRAARAASFGFSPERFVLAQET